MPGLCGKLRGQGWSCQCGKALAVALTLLCSVAVLFSVGPVYH